MNAIQMIKSIRSETADRKERDKREIELIRKHKAAINLLDAGDWSWRVVTNSYWPAEELLANILCDNEADVKVAARLARAICHCRSDKQLDKYEGTMTYKHESSDGSINLTVKGGAPLPGCELIERVSYSEPYRQVRYEIACK